MDNSEHAGVQLEVRPPEHSGPDLGVAVEHRAPLAGAIALVAAVMTVAWFARALQADSVLDWFLCALSATVAVVQLLVVRDSRAPLMLADDQGVRVRRGETWTGLRWQDIDHVEVQSPGSWLRDGRIVVHPREVVGDEPAISPEIFSVPLALTTRLRFDGLTGDLVTDLDALASGRTPVVVVTRLEPEVSADEVTDEVTEPEKPSRRERREQRAADRLLAEADAEEQVDEPVGQTTQEEVPETSVVHSGVEIVVLSAGDGEDGPVLPHQATAEERDPAEEPVEAPVEAPVGAAPVDEGVEAVVPLQPEFDPVEPVRETRPAARSESVRESVRAASMPIPAQRAGEGPVVVARVDDIETQAPRPARNAMIGPVIAAARNRARLSIDTLSDRTRIRPHVLECIEVDDFDPCGGDFYARGHIRTLARIFGLDADELLALYDEHYAGAEIEARQVFDAELATGIGGGMRATFTGPRWSLLAASVIALALVWGIAHVFTDKPQELVSPAPNVDSAGLTHAQPAATPTSTLAALGVTAVGASPQVVVRDRDGHILWAGKLAQGQHQQVVGMAPFDVTTSNGTAVKVSFLGKTKGTVGPTSAADSKTFG